MLPPLPSVLTPPRSRATHRYLLPSASVMDHGAQMQGGVASPAVYPFRHIYVDEGTASPWQDGTPEAPYASLEHVLKDKALEAVCAIISLDYIHIHLRQNAPCDLTKTGTVFDGGGKDFHGRLVIEPWPGESMAHIRGVMDEITVLKPLDETDQAEAYRNASDPYLDFYLPRHVPITGLSSKRTISLFRNLHGVFFHRIHGLLDYRHTFSGYQEDIFGNNSPMDAMASADLALFSRCHGCGFHQCNLSATADISLEFPDPVDILYEGEIPEYILPEDDGNTGKISPVIVPPPMREYGGGAIGPDWESPEIPEYRVYSIPIDGRVKLSMACLKAAKAFRAAENRFSCQASVRSVGGCVAQAYGILSSEGGFSRILDAIAQVDAKDRESVYTAIYITADGTRHSYHHSIHGGACAAAIASGHGSTWRSTLRKDKATSTATATAIPSPRLSPPTEKPWRASMALSSHFLECRSNRKEGISSALHAQCLSPWKSHAFQKSGESLSGEDIPGFSL